MKMMIILVVCFYTICLGIHMGVGNGAWGSMGVGMWIASFFVDHFFVDQIFGNGFSKNRTLCECQFIVQMMISLVGVGAWGGE